MTQDSEKLIGLSEVDALRHDGVITAEQYLEAAQYCREADYWRRWATRALLVLAASHLLGGVVFFFAYNWADLGAFTKFALLQGGIVLAVIAALVVGISRAGGQALLIAASLFVGVLFAVVGQVYQTGADAYELFAAWSLLILPWVIASRSSAHWFFWMVICLTALSLYGAQVLLPLDVLTDEEVTMAVGFLAIVFLATRERAVIAGFREFDTRWLRVSLAMIGVAAMFMPAFTFVFDSDSSFFALVAFAAIVAVLGFVYFNILPDFAIIAIVTGFSAILLMAIGGRGIHEVIGFGDSTGSLIMSLLLLVVWCGMLTAGTVRILNRVHGTMMAADADG